MHNVPYIYNFNIAQFKRAYLCNHKDSCMLLKIMKCWNKYAEVMITKIRSFKQETFFAGGGRGAGAY